jgi:hypothetical protein
MALRRLLPGLPLVALPPHMTTGCRETIRMVGAGGTPGGLPQFLIGLALAAAGAYLLTKQVTVQTGHWTIGGYNAFGLSLVPFIFGIGLLFFDGSSKAGFILLFIGIVIIAAGILMNLSIYFQPTSLFNTLMMIGMTAGGIGLLLRGLKSS